jgi:hypothetical protein
MNTEELEKYKKIPRHDILIYLHQNEFLGNNVKIRDIYDRINKPNYVFYSIIDDLIGLKLIDCKKYSSRPNDNGSYFPDNLASVEIKLTPLGEDFVESKLFGYNIQKFPKNSPLDSFKVGKMSGNLPIVCNWSYEYFSQKWNHNIIDVKSAYFILTGHDYKDDGEKKIFISYSWDNEDHKNWVKKLAYDLNSRFNVEFDENLKVGMNPYNYMKQNILSSDYVIIVFTSEYFNKIHTNKDTGVRYEFSIIKDELFRKISIGKYIPILREGTKETSIPKIMQDAIYVDFSDKDCYVENLKEIKEIIKN